VFELCAEYHVTGTTLKKKSLVILLTRKQNSLAEQKGACLSGVPKEQVHRYEGIKVKKNPETVFTDQKSAEKNLITYIENKNS